MCIKAELLAKDKADKKKSIEDNLKAVDQGIADEKLALSKKYAEGLIDKFTHTKNSKSWNKKVFVVNYPSMDWKKANAKKLNKK